MLRCSPSLRSPRSLERELPRPCASPVSGKSGSPDAAVANGRLATSGYRTRQESCPSSDFEETPSKARKALCIGRLKASRQAISISTSAPSGESHPHLLAIPNKARAAHASSIEEGSTSNTYSARTHGKWIIRIPCCGIACVGHRVDTRTSSASCSSDSLLDCATCSGGIDRVHTLLLEGLGPLRVTLTREPTWITRVHWIVARIEVSRTGRRYLGIHGQELPGCRAVVAID